MYEFRCATGPGPPARDSCVLRRGARGLGQELWVQCRALLGLNIAYARLRRLVLFKDVIVLPVYVCDAWLGKFGVVQKVSGFTAKDSKPTLRSRGANQFRAHAVLSRRVKLPCLARAVRSSVLRPRRAASSSSPTLRTASCQRNSKAGMATARGSRPLWASGNSSSWGACGAATVARNESRRCGCCLH